MRINHNISAQLANVSIKRTETNLSLSLNRLSSGYKITKAADDSAGMAITNKMRTQISALEQATRNAEDGQSIVETADGALSEVHNILQRIRELSVQSANDTYTLEDRTSAQSEINQLMEEIDRISETTEFNGKKIIDGSCAREITSSQDSIKAISTSMTVPSGEYKFQVTELAQPAIAEGAVTYTIPDKGSDRIEVLYINNEAIKITSSDTDDTVKQKVVSVCDKMNISVEGKGSGMTLRTNGVGSKQIIKISIGEEGTYKTFSGTDAVVELDEEKMSKASYRADGNYITIVGENGFNLETELPDLWKYSEDKRGDVSYSEVALGVYNAGYMTVQIRGNETQTLNMDFPEVSCQTLGLKDKYGFNTVNVCSSQSATSTITTIDNAISKVSTARATLGAYENRLENTVSSLRIASENMTNSMSRIMDTDMASEMTRYTQLDVLKQASSSMLAQANNRPQQVMSILQGM